MTARQREFIARVESAGATEFAALFAGAGRAESEALRRHFGGTLLAGACAGTDHIPSGPAKPAAAHQKPGPREIVILPGILGSHLGVESRRGVRPVWLSPWTLVRGGLATLRIHRPASPMGVLKRYYGRQILHFARRWRVTAFAYDWRLSIHTNARLLAETLGGRPAHLVAHSLGGLVARAFLQFCPRHEGRLIMLGTPNRGSFAVTQLLYGMHGLLKALALLDVKHSREELREIIAAWPSIREMNPAAAALGELPVEPARMTYIAGSGHRTAVAIRDAGRLHQRTGYEWSTQGDGTVPHSLGALPGVPTYFAAEEHGGLPGSATVLAAVEEILLTGTCSLPAHGLPGGLPGVGGPRSRRAVKGALNLAHEAALSDRLVAGFLAAPRSTAPVNERDGTAG